MTKIFLLGKKSKAFTLIELLIVVAIIGVLSSIVSISVKSSFKESRDAKRLQEIKSIRNALELYNVDHGKYPEVKAISSPTDTGWPVLEAALSPYMSLPKDPLPDQYFYYYNGNGQDTSPGYGFMCTIESKGYSKYALEDGGYYNTVPFPKGPQVWQYYEVGAKPAYDKSLGLSWWDD